MSIKSIDKALEVFLRLRGFHVRYYQLISQLFTPFYQSDSKLLPLLRDYLAAPASRLPIARGILSDLVSGMLGGPLERLDLNEAKTTEKSPPQ